MGEGDSYGGLYVELLCSLEVRGECNFDLSTVPRARQELMFAQGRVDLLVSAASTPARDRVGDFLPVMRSRPLLLTLEPALELPRTGAELSARRDLTVAVVRGFDYGDVYQAFVHDLAQQKRLVEASNVQSAARLLRHGLARLILMSPVPLYGEMLRHEALSRSVPDLRVAAVPELPWLSAGIYITRHESLLPADRERVRVLLAEEVGKGTAWEHLSRQFPQVVLREGMRPL